MRTFVCTPTWDIVRKSATRTVVADFESPGFFQTFPRGQRPAYSFNLTLEPLFRYGAEQLESFHAFHQGGLSFMFDGGPYGVVDHYQFLAEGDGVSSTYYMYNRNIGTGSHSVQTRNQATQATSIWSTAAYSVHLTPGILLFGSTVPASGFDIEMIYACKYQCVFEPEGFDVSEFAKGIFRAKLSLREKFI